MSRVDPSIEEVTEALATKMGMSSFEERDAIIEAAAQAYVRYVSLMREPSDEMVEAAANAVDDLPYDTLELRNWGEESVPDPALVVARAALAVAASVLLASNEENE